MEVIWDVPDGKCWQLGPHRWEQSREIEYERYSGTESAGSGGCLGLRGDQGG